MVSRRAFPALTKFQKENTVSSFRPIILCQSKLTEFCPGLSKFGPALQQASLSKQHSRNSIPHMLLDLPFFRRQTKGSSERGVCSRISPFSRVSRDSRDFRDSSRVWKSKEIRPVSRDAREFRDSRDSRVSPQRQAPFCNPVYRNPPSYLSPWPKLFSHSVEEPCP